MKQQKIYIEGLGLVDGHFSGVGQYILGVLKGIDEVIEDNVYEGIPTPKVFVIIPRDMVEKFKKFNFKYIGYKKFPLPFRYTAALWHRGKLPPLDVFYGRGFYVFPRFVGTRLLFSKSANVIFDLSYELHREYSDERNAKFLSDGVKRTLKSSSKVITISKNAKKEIVDFYQLPEKKVVVAYPATDPAVLYRRSKQEINKVKLKYGIKGDYILALSNLEPRKNLEALVEAYCRLPKKITDEIALLLVGVTGWKTDALFEKIVKKVDEGANIIRPSKYVTDEDKPAIISGAKVLVYPSHYEGFGMPPLEALACGVPVIAAQNSSLPEVVKGVGSMVKSTDSDALHEELVDYLTNIEAKTEAVREAGPERAQKFSWKKSGQVILDIAKEIAK